MAFPVKKKEEKPVGKASKPVAKVPAKKVKK